MTIITISRQYGSGGDEIAARVCELLGYRMFDKHLISQAAADAGLSEQEMLDFSEDSHKIRSFLDRLLGREPVVARMRIWKESETGEKIAEESQVSETVALDLVQKAIRTACKQGNLVIVGRGGQALLRDCPGTLHVRIEAPLEERIQRLKGQLKEARQEYRADIESRRATQDIIQAHDDASADYVARFYQADWNDPMLYHIVINTGRMSVEQAAQAIARLAPSFVSEESSREAVGL